MVWMLGRLEEANEGQLSRGATFADLDILGKRPEGCGWIKGLRIVKCGFSQSLSAQAEGLK